MGSLLVGLPLPCSGSPGWGYRGPGRVRVTFVPAPLALGVPAHGATWATPWRVPWVGGSPKHLGEGRGTRGARAHCHSEGHTSWAGPQTPTGSPNPSWRGARSCRGVPRVVLGKGCLGWGGPAGTGLGCRDRVAWQGDGDEASSALEVAAETPEPVPCLSPATPPGQCHPPRTRRGGAFRG